jgi:integrase
MLSRTFIRECREPGKHRDDNNLYLQIPSQRPAGGSWVFIYSHNGKSHGLGLGPRLRDAGEVRADARDLRDMLAKGIDPLEHRAKAIEAEQQQRARATTFSAAVASYLAAHETAWRNEKTRRARRRMFAVYAETRIGDKPVSEIGTDEVLAVLKPIWTAKPPTGSSLREQLELVLDYARVRGWRDGENPARWRGHLKLMLPAPTRIRPVVHRAALDWREAPGFMAMLRATDGIAARCLECIVLNAVRFGEAREATWDEIDGRARVWTIPGSHTKTRKAHRIPLSDAALELFDRVGTTRALGRLVFPAVRDPQKPMHGTVLARLLGHLGHNDLTVHGFRSSFRDWAGEATHHPNHVVEMALAHTVGDKVEAAYRRGDLFDKRRQLMADWAKYLAQPTVEIVQIAAAE